MENELISISLLCERLMMSKTLCIWNIWCSNTLNSLRLLFEVSKELTAWSQVVHSNQTFLALTRTLCTVVNMTFIRDFCFSNSVQTCFYGENDVCVRFAVLTAVASCYVLNELIKMRNEETWYQTWPSCPLTFPCSITQGWAIACPSPAEFSTGCYGMWVRLTVAEIKQL